MVKRSLIVFFLLSALLLTAVAIGTAWLAGTNRGTRWLLGSLGRWTPVEISAEAVGGRLADDLRLEGFSVRWSGGTLSGKELSLSWHPLQLLDGKVAIESLSARDVVLRTAMPAGATAPPSSWSWPHPSRSADWLRAAIRTLDVEKFVWQRPGRAPLAVERVHVGLDWQFGRLKLRQLTAKTSQGTLSGTAEAVFSSPALSADLTLQPAAAVAGLQRFSLRARLHPAVGPDFLAGALEIAGTGRADAAFTLRGDLRFGPGGVRLARLRLERPERPGQVTGHIALLPVPAGLRLRLALEGEGFRFGAFAAPEHFAVDLDVSGSLTSYRGRYSFADLDSGWRHLAATGSVSGSALELTSPDFSASWLGGKVQGAVHAAWDDALRLDATLNGADLDPALWRPEWPGRLNFELGASFSRRKAGEMQASLAGRLLASTLRGEPLSGEVAATLAGTDLRVERLVLSGPGVDVAVHGRLSQRLDFSLRLDQLGLVDPEVAGQMHGSGWFAWRGGTLWGEAATSARDLAIRDFHAAALSLQVGRSAPLAPFTVAVQGRQIRFGNVALATASLSASGQPDNHHGRFSLSSAAGTVAGVFAGGYAGERWTGTLQSLTAEGPDLGRWRLAKAMSLSVTRAGLTVPALHLTSAAGEDLIGDGELTFKPFSGKAHGRWTHLVLGRLSPWLTDWRLAGRSDGELDAAWSAAGDLDLTAKGTASGRVAGNGLDWQVSGADASLKWNAAGLAARATLALADGGHAEAHLSSPEPGRLALPRQGHLELAAYDLPLASLQPFIPTGVRVKGRLGATAAGDWSDGNRLALSGSARVGAAALQWRGETGELSVPVRTGTLSWTWHDASLRGELNVALQGMGQISGRFQLPIPARLPLGAAADGAVSGEVTAVVSEHGLVAALFPGTIQESRGELTLKVRLGGTWRNPAWDGALALRDAAAVVPVAGIRVSGITVQAHLSGDRVFIDSFAAHSGKGTLSGTGQLTLQGWRPKSYSGTLKGKNFELLHLPELEVAVDPDLNFSGTLQALKVRGRVLLPEVLVTSTQSASLVTPSDDVLVIDAPKPAAAPSRFALDAQIEIELGKQVLVRVHGVDASLSGKVALQANGRGRPSGNGELRVVKGTYSTYGVRLQIVRGHLLFAGGPIDQPTLDILAERTVGDVQAGVQISGTPRSPQVKLTSTPTLPDTDILAYIVLGHPLGQGESEASLLMLAAGSLLSKGQSTVLQERLNRRLGLDVLEVKSQTTTTTAAPTITSTGAVQTNTTSVQSTVVTIGKYINPDLYISLGHSLFTNTNQAGLRYTFSPRWEIESKMGSDAGGVDLYYKIEFR